MTDVALRPRPRFSDLDPAALALWLEEHQLPAYRARQLRHGLWQRRVRDFAQMTDLPAKFRQFLAAEFAIQPAQVVAHQKSSDGTEKLLLRMTDGSDVECVLMREEERRTICISTQVGCAMGCVFCASGLLGVKRNLTRGEILEQVLQLDGLLPDGERITNIVVMGIGEPLANLANLLSALEELHSDDGYGLGARRITISTVGLPEKIRELARSGRAYNLAVSLHAPNDEVRNVLVPTNKKIGIDAVLAAADDFFETTGRRVTYEYVLLGGCNDAPEHARELGRRLAHRTAHVNLIPMNAIADLPYTEPSQARQREFVAILSQSGVTATIRKRKGADIDAACGQLRLNRHNAEPELTELSAS